MSDSTKRSTIYFEPQVHQALRSKAALTHQSVSYLVNEAVRNVLQEDQEDLKVFDARMDEPTLTYEELLNDLNSHS